MTVVGGVAFRTSDLADLVAEMRRLPEQVQAQAGPIVHRAADVFERAMKEKFPTEDDSGELRKDTATRVSEELRVVVGNSLHYAPWYEFGFRHYTAGTTRRTHTRTRRFGGAGVMVAGKRVWVPAAQSARAEMMQELRDLVQTGQGLSLQVFEVRL